MNRRTAFTLPEVMIALFILASSMFVLSELQVKSMMQVWAGREDIDRLYTIKKFLYKAYLNPKKATKSTRSFESPAMKLTIQPMPVHKKSSLAPYAEYLQVLASEGKWVRGGHERRIPMVSFALRAEQTATQEGR